MSVHLNSIRMPLRRKKDPRPLPGMLLALLTWYQLACVSWPGLLDDEAQMLCTKKSKFKKSITTADHHIHVNQNTVGTDQVGPTNAKSHSSINVLLFTYFQYSDLFSQYISFCAKLSAVVWFALDCNSLISFGSACKCFISQPFLYVKSDCFLVPYPCTFFLLCRRAFSLSQFLVQSLLYGEASVALLNLLSTDIEAVDVDSGYVWLSLLFLSVRLTEPVTSCSGVFHMMQSTS